MGTIIGFAILAFIAWILVVRGILFRLILAIFAFMGMYGFLWNDFPNSHTTFMTIMDYSISWAAFIPALIILLAMATTSVKND